MESEQKVRQIFSRKEGKTEVRIEMGNPTGGANMSSYRAYRFRMDPTEEQ